MVLPGSSSGAGNAITSASVSSVVWAFVSGLAWILKEDGVAVIEGPVPRPAADGTTGASVYFRDPDGNLLELLSTVA